jgi:hypothetical protein
MSKHTITIELSLGPEYEQGEDGDFYPVDSPGFHEQILARVASMFLSRLDFNDRNALDRIVRDRADEAIDARLGKMIEEVVAGPLRKYDYQGKPTGEPFTINELIVQAIERFAAAPAGRDTYSNKAPANLAEVVKRAVDEALRNELSKDVAAIRASVAAEIKERLTGATAEAITKGR